MHKTTKRPKRQKQKSRLPADSKLDQRGADFPYWLPVGRDWDELPESIRVAVDRILVPAYRQFVVDAASEIERAVGCTLVHLVWLEICDQVRMAAAAANPDSLGAILVDPDVLIERCLRLSAVKCQTAELLVKIRAFSQALRPLRIEAVPAIPAPAEYVLAGVS